MSPPSPGAVFAGERQRPGRFYRGRGGTKSCPLELLNDWPALIAFSRKHDKNVMLLLSDHDIISIENKVHAGLFFFCFFFFESSNSIFLPAKIRL